MNEVISTATCFALLTSRAARGLLAIHGYAPKIIAPQMPEGWGEAGAPKPNGVHERKLRLVMPEVETPTPAEPGDEGDGA